MQNLRLLQQSFTDAIFDSRLRSENVYERITENGISAQDRLQIYRNNVFSSYTAALSSVFDVTRQLVGDDFFKYLAHEYIPQHKSVSGNIHQFGDNFAEFITTHPALTELAYLADVAHFEWAKHEVFHAPFASLQNITDLNSLPASDIDNVIFATHPALRVISSSYPILSIWQFHQQSLDEQSELSIELRAESILVFRPNLEIEFQILSQADTVLLAPLIQQHSFSQVCAHFSQQCPDTDIGMCLQTLIHRKMITGFTVDS